MGYEPATEISWNWIELVENREMYIPHLYLTPPSEFRKDIQYWKAKMVGLLYAEEIMMIC